MAGGRGGRGGASPGDEERDGDGRVSTSWLKCDEVSSERGLRIRCSNDVLLDQGWDAGLVAMGVGGVRLRFGDEVDASRKVGPLEEEGVMRGVEEEDARRFSRGS